MALAFQEAAARVAVFNWLEALAAKYADALPRTELERGCPFASATAGLIQVIGPQGIFKPKDFALLWVAKTSSAHKSLICSDLRPSCYPLFSVLWPTSTPREQQFATHRVAIANLGGTNNSASVSLSFLNIRLLPALILYGPAGANYNIQSEPALTASSIWTSLTDVTLPVSQPYIYVDPSSITNSQQFYRAEPE